MDTVGTLDDGGQEDPRCWCHAQRRTLVLCQMIAIEAGLIGVFQALQALFVQVRELELVAINPVEDAKLHRRRVRSRLHVVINHRVTSVRPWRGRAREAVSEISPASLALWRQQ